MCLSTRDFEVSTNRGYKVVAEDAEGFFSPIRSTHFFRYDAENKEDDGGFHIFLKREDAECYLSLLQRLQQWQRKISISYSSSFWKGIDSLQIKEVTFSEYTTGDFDFNFPEVLTKRYFARKNTQLLKARS